MARIVHFFGGIIIFWVRAGGECQTLDKNDDNVG